ncbi:MAG: NUDIX domain-containing protein [Verrucomicrobiaceae bacterium]|nr:NUDIX domain-containing protein [Verrucomicrobiaceae bacterium]
MPRPYQFCSDCGTAEPRQVNEREFRCEACDFRHFITPVPAAVALILDAQDRLLVIRRAHEPGLGKLGLPGGVIEPEETGEMGAARETLEETGLRVPVEAFSYFTTLNNRYLFQDFEWPTIDLFFFARVQSFDGVQIDTSEVSEWMAVPLADVALHDFAFGSNAEAVRLLQVRNALR